MNDHCYHKEEIQLNSGALDGAVSKAYLLTMVDSKRPWREKLRDFPLCSSVTVIYNHGFRNCQKQLLTQISYCDLQDAFAYICRDAVAREYDNILVLEDDFVVLDRDQAHYHSVNNFLLSRSFDVYNLGPSTVFSTLPPIFSHNRCLFFRTTHAVIYSRRYLQWYLDHGLRKAEHLDETFNNLSTVKFAYYKPLIGQTFPMTENRLNWKNCFLFFTDWWITIWRLDTSCENYKYQQWAFSWLFWIITGLLIYGGLRLRLKYWS